jgi:hypothetical protein
MRLIVSSCPNGGAHNEVLRGVHPDGFIGQWAAAAGGIPAHLARRGQQQTAVGGEILKGSEAGAGTDDGGGDAGARDPASMKLQATILCGRPSEQNPEVIGREAGNPFSMRIDNRGVDLNQVHGNTNLEIRPGRPLLRRSMSPRETSGHQNGPDSRAHIRAANTGGTRLVAGPFDGFPDVTGVK